MEDRDEPAGRAMSLGHQRQLCVRSLVIDRWVQTFLRCYPEGAVVEIGAGLTTRFERLENGTGYWFDIDTDAALAVRRRYFRETRRRQFVTVPEPSAERSSEHRAERWVAQLRAHSRGPYFFVAEDASRSPIHQSVRQLCDSIVEAFPGAWLACDALPQWSARTRGDGEELHELLQSWDRRYRVLESCRDGRLTPSLRRQLPWDYRVRQRIRGLFRGRVAPTWALYLARLG